MFDPNVWQIDPHDINNRTTLALISICIKRNPRQTLRELAKQLSEDKRRPVAECLEVLKYLQDRGQLGYFVHKKYKYVLRNWAPATRRACTFRYRNGIKPPCEQIDCKDCKYYKEV